MPREATLEKAKRQKHKIKERGQWNSRHGAAETNLTRNHKVACSISGLAQRVKDLVLLWLWHRPVATALIRPLAWEPPYATGVALKKDKNKRV